MTGDPGLPDLECLEVLGDEFRCQLAAGHWGGHVHHTEGARITWDQIRPFDEATPGDEAYLWKPEKGTTEYAFWTDAEGVTDGADDPITVTKQRWRLIAERQETWIPSLQLCDLCFGEGVIDEDDTEIDCPTCDGSGQHPDAGTWTTR